MITFVSDPFAYALFPSLCALCVCALCAVQYNIRLLCALCWIMQFFPSSSSSFVYFLLSFANEVILIRLLFHIKYILVFGFFSLLLFMTNNGLYMCVYGTIVNLSYIFVFFFYAYFSCVLKINGRR